MRTTLVTAADASYFDLLSDHLASIEGLRLQIDVDLHILDVGLLPEQVGSLRARTQGIIQPGWDLPFPGEMPPWFRAMTSRPFLPRYLPNHDLFIWLDSDTWLQDGRAIHLLIEAAAGNRLAIVPELHRAYAYLYGRTDVRKAIADVSLQGWDEHTAEKLIALPILNSGVFALHRDAPHWAIWQSELRWAVARTQHRLVEQTALNLTIYKHSLPVHFLPAWCNWICFHALPVLDESTNTLAEPFLPHDKLSIIHLTETRRARVMLQTITGQTHETGLTYSSIRGRGS